MQWRRLPPCPLVIALVPVKTYYVAKTWFIFIQLFIYLFILLNSFYNWETQTSTSNPTPNYQVIAENASGLLFKNKRDRKILNVDPKVSTLELFGGFTVQRKTKAGVGSELTHATHSIGHALRFCCGVPFAKFQNKCSFSFTPYQRETAVADQEQSSRSAKSFALKKLIFVIDSWPEWLLHQEIWVAFLKNSVWTLQTILSFFANLFSSLISSLHQNRQPHLAIIQPVHPWPAHSIRRSSSMITSQGGRHKLISQSFGKEGGLCLEIVLGKRQEVITYCFQWMS